MRAAIQTIGIVAIGTILGAQSVEQTVNGTRPPAVIAAASLAGAPLAHPVGRAGAVVIARDHRAELQHVPVLGEPDDIAYGAIYLASDVSRYVTGISLPIDGGSTNTTALSETGDREGWAEPKS